MSVIKTFRFSDKKDFHTWSSACNSLPQCDIYSYPEYALAYEMNGDGNAYGCLYQENGGAVFYVFLKRSVNQLDFVGRLDREIYDISSPYGYGGAVCSVVGPGRKDLLINSFLSAFGSYCKKENIVSEFIRFNPLLNNHRPYNGYLNLRMNSITVYIDLTGTPESIWSGFNSSNKRNINKARKFDLQVQTYDNLETYHDFIKLYYLTMDRLNASPYYFFSENYFKVLRNNLKDKLLLFGIKRDGRLIAAALILACGKSYHYHLGCSDSECLELRPNNLLFYEIALYGQRVGFTNFHLGGGGDHINSDSLLKFKTGFSKERAEFYIGRKIHNEHLYNRICKLWRASYSQKQGPLGIDYFPLYRSKTN